MKILLIDVDSKIPNIALMKISTYYKKQGSQVELKKLNYEYYKKDKNQTIINAEGYDKVYVSIIFKCNKHTIQVLNCLDVIIAGSGYDLTIKLPQKIDDCEEDYSIYPDNDSSYGFITRGCIRNCYFCIVPKKEGMISYYRDIHEIVKHRKVYFLDNNILAYDKHKNILKELVNSKIKCQFNQGLDIRLIDEQNAELLSKINYLGEYFFAFDDIYYQGLIEEKLKILKQFIVKDWKIKFFLYCHPDMKVKDDVLFRINWCKQHNFLPYLMRDESCFSDKNQDVYTDLAAWCNQPSIFKKMTFEEFMSKRHTNKERIERVLEIVK